MQKIGLYLLAAGAIVMVGYWAYEFIEFLAPLRPWPFLAAMVNFLLGGILILVAKKVTKIQKIGFLLFAAGTAVIVGYGIYDFIEFLVPLGHWSFAIATVAFFLGGIFILASLIWERM